MAKARDIFATGSVELAGDAKRRLVGYAARYNVESHPIFKGDVHRRPFVEIIRPGAFSGSLDGRRDVLALFNHDHTRLLGRTASGTLRLSDDAVGLRFELDIPGTTLGFDVRAMVERRDINACSVGMFVLEDEIISRDGPTDLRIVHKANLDEITPAVTRPAYDSTSVEARALALAGVRPPTPRLDYALRRRQALALRLARPDH